MIDVPVQFRGNEYLERAYRHGYNHGHGVACHNVPDLWGEYWTEAEGRLVATPETIKSVHEALTYEAARLSRAFSPHEILPQDVDRFGDGGFFIIVPYGEDAIGAFDYEDDAEKEAESLGLEDYEIQFIPALQEIWEAFEAGEWDAIMDDMASYGASDYGFDDESEDDSEDEDSEDDSEA